MKRIISAGTILLIYFFASCNKQNEWLETKPNRSDLTPVTIENYQALLDYSEESLNLSTPSIGLMGTDNYYVTNATYNATGNAAERNGYIWARDTWEGSNSPDWEGPYSAIGTANIVLDGISKITPNPSTQKTWNNVKGSALFMRAFAYYNLAQLFMKPYDPVNAANDPGLVLRTNSDINSYPGRSSVEETYRLIENDIRTAIPMLQDAALYQTRPNKQAAYGLLAKLYLVKGDYLNAGSNAAKALQVSENLLDFNTLNPAASKTMPVFPAHPEISFYATTFIYTLLTPSGSRCIVDSNLFQSYSANDLRKTIFFTAPNTSGQVFFKGQYSAGQASFSGIANNELMLILSESQARQSQVPEALATLNKLLMKRWKSNTFVAMTATNPQDCLQKILTERRKELPFTSNTRWEDLRRLNQDPLFTKTLTRMINNQTYTLPPNDNRYVLPIPDLEIRLGGIAQNPR
jgi:tetratricopeptide (TPR) repeat protein